MVSPSNGAAGPGHGDPADDGENPSLWTGSYVMAMVVQLGASTVFVTLMTYMALYAMERFSVEGAAAGFAASAFILGSAFARIFAGKYVDFIGRKRLIVGALLVFVVCSALYPLVWSYPSLIGLRVVHGAAFGSISTAITTAVVGMVPLSRRGEGMGYFLAASTFAMALGPLLAVQLTEAFGSGPVFVLTGAASCMSLAAAFVFKAPERTPGPEERARRFRIHATDVLDPRALPVSLVVLLTAFGYAGVVTYLNPFLLERGMTTAASWFFVVFAAGMLVIRLFSGRHQDHRGDNAVIVPLTTLFAASLVIMGLATQTWHIVLAGALAGLGYGGLLPSLQVVAVTRANPERVGIAMSTHYLLLDAGVALGPVLFGLIIPLAGYQGLYLALAATVMIGVGLYWGVHGRNKAT